MAYDPRRPRRFGSTSRRPSLPPIGTPSTRSLYEPGGGGGGSIYEDSGGGGGGGLLGDILGKIKGSVAEAAISIVPGGQTTLPPLWERAEKRSEPRTALNVVARGLNVGQNVGAGMLRGALKSNNVSLLDIMKGEDPTPPWVAANQLYDMFSEVPGAVGENLTYEQVLEENNNPNSFLYRHAAPIGFTMSIFWDPTTYLSLGATTPSKIAAHSMMAMTHREAAVVASRKIAQGAANPRTGAPYREDEKLLAVLDTLGEVGGPATLGDALKAIRGAGGEGLIRQHAGAYAPKILPGQRRLGGQGIRFMGAEIPGTPQLFAAAGPKARAARAKVMRGTGAEKVVGMVVPDAAARHIMDDMTRASALSVIGEMKNVQNAENDVLSAFADDLFKANLHYVDPQGVAQIKPVAEAIPMAERRGLLRVPEGGTVAKEQALLDLVKNRVDVATKAASARGVDINSMERLWDTMAANFDDPVHAAARYLTHVELRVKTKDLERRVLDDPRFAYQLVSKGKTAAQQPGLQLKAPVGYTEVTKGSKKYAVVDAVADALDDLRNDALTNRWLEDSMQVLNWSQNWWKTYATVPNPSFHVTNLLGAVWNNLLAGVYNPMDYARAGAALYRSRMQEAALEGRTSIGAPLRAMRGEAPQQTAKRAEAAEFVGAAKARGGLGRASWFHAELAEKNLTHDLLTPSGVRAKLGELVSIPEEFKLPKQIPGRVTTEGRMAPRYKKRVIPPLARTVGRRGRQAGSLALLATPAAPLAAAGLLPEMAAVGRKIGGGVEDWVRMTAFTKYAKDPQLLRAIEAFGPPQVYGNITSPHFSKKHQEAMYDIAANISKHFQFDYSDLTNFERFLAKTVFPFYTFYRKNFALQATELGKHPGTLATTQKMMNYLNDHAGEDMGPMEALLPDYFNNLEAFQIPVPDSVRGLMGLPKDQPLFLNPKLPFVSLNLFPPLWQLFQPDEQGRVGPTPQKLGAILAPIAGSVGPYTVFPGAKAYFEYTVNRQLGLNRPIDFQRARSQDERNNFVDAPGWVKYLPEGIYTHFNIFKSPTTGAPTMTASSKYMLEQLSTPFISNFGSAIPTTGTEEEQGRARADLVSWATGIRLMPADPLKLNRNYAYTLRGILDSKEAELKERGQTLSLDDEELKVYVERAIESIEFAWDQREQALYPEETGGEEGGYSPTPGGAPTGGSIYEG